MNNKYFPQGIATDKSFCNRNEERIFLKSSIEAHEHTVLVAPRRYGKTSLIIQVLKESDFPGCHIDFFFVLNQKEVVKQVAEAVSAIITKMLPRAKSTINKIIDSLKSLNPRLTFNLFGQTLEVGTKHSSEKSISELLLALDSFASQTKNSCVIVMDEFQQIGELKENHTIEAAIRHAVERSANVSYIFCGSKHHLLNEMFSDKSRPLYHLCDLMTIDRIHADSYIAFLNKNAKRKWGENLSDDVTNEIIYLTERHPYYINALCRRLWRNDKLPTIDDVNTTWGNYVSQQSAWITTDISALTLNRKKVLSAIACQPTKEPQGHDFSGRAGLPPSAIKKKLNRSQKIRFHLSE